MKRKLGNLRMKRLILKTLIFVLLFGLGSIHSLSAHASNVPKYLEYANELKQLGLFNGSDKGFELERAPTRVEAAAMLINLLGKEAEAKEKNFSHPFTDVPSWANHIIGYMYQNKMTSGIGNNQFGSRQLISARDFTVFVVKSLGYGGSDFEYAKTMDFAKSINLINADEYNELMNGSFIRDKMVLLSKNAINTNTKGSNDRLIDVLVDNKVVNINDANLQGYYDYPAVPLVITGDAKSGYQFEYLFKEMTKGVYDELILVSFEGSNAPTFLGSEKEMAADMAVSKEMRPFYIKQYSEIGFVGLDKGRYEPKHYYFRFAYDKNMEIAYYFEVPRNLSAGKYLLALIPASDNLIKLTREFADKLESYINQRMPLVVEFADTAYTITNNSTLELHRDKLPEALKNFKGFSIGSFGSKPELKWLLEQEYRRIYKGLDVGGYNDVSVANFGIKGQNLLTLYDDQGRMIGYSHFYVGN